MQKTISYVCSIYTAKNQKTGEPVKVFAVITLNFDMDKGNIVGSPVATTLPISALVDRLKKGAIFDNVKLNEAGNGVTHKTGTFSRFNAKDRVRPKVIVAKFVREGSDKAVGYLTVDDKAKLMSERIEAVTAYCKACKGSDRIPYQNMQYKGLDETQHAVLAMYTDSEIPTFVLQPVVSKHVVENKLDIEKNRKALEKEQDVFTPEQRAILKDLKDSGFSPLIIANPKFSVEQMKILASGIKTGVDVKPFANPQYQAVIMQFFISEIKCKRPITPMLNPKYDTKQVVEIAMGIDSGVDISKYANPNKPAEKMREYRESMESKLWCTMQNVKMTIEWTTWDKNVVNDKKVKRFKQNAKKASTN